MPTLTKFSPVLSKWDERFIRIAKEVAGWSKDPGTKVGAVLVCDRRIIATGYNGFPHGISDSLERYADRDVKIAYTVHAEVNAILNAAKNGSQTDGSALYVTFPPCVSCSSAIIQAGITHVVPPHLSTSPDRWRKSFHAGHNLLLEAGVLVTSYLPSDYV
jgi:dCMP deaminase